MKPFVTKYKYECITAALCGALCLAFIARELDLGGVDDIRFWEWGLFREVYIYQNGTARVRLEGKSVKDAVETRLKRIRAANIVFDGDKVNSIRINRIGVLLRLRRLTEVFQDINLEGAALAGLDFRGVSLVRANLVGADLSEVRLEGAQLGGACLDGANLAGARFGPRQADLPKFDWLEADSDTIEYLRRDDDLQDLYPDAFSNASFKGAKLLGATLRLSTSDALDLKGADLTDALIEIAPSDQADAGRFFKEVLYDEFTIVRGLRLAGAIDRNATFVRWAQERGAVLLEPAVQQPETDGERARP